MYLHGERILLRQRLPVLVREQDVAVGICGGALAHIVRVVLAAIRAVPLCLANRRPGVLQRRIQTCQEICVPPQRLGHHQFVRNALCQVQGYLNHSSLNAGLMQGTLRLQQSLSTVSD